MGASEFLNRRLNEEFQRAFEAGIPSSAAYPSSEIYDTGTPSDRPTSKGFRSAVSHGTSSVPSHPTSSPVSFGPSTSVQSASAAPAGLQSSPGGMSDVGSTLTPPGLPLRDPPRVAASYGLPLNDPVFGISSGSIPCKNPGHSPIPPPPQQGVGDPVAQLLMGQGAMSQLKAGDPSQSSGQGSTSGSRKEMKMDEKWIPSMPIASWKNWTSRGKQLSGFKSWLQQFSGWPCLIHDAYAPELFFFGGAVRARSSDGHQSICNDCPFPRMRKSETIPKVSLETKATSNKQKQHKTATNHKQQTNNPGHLAKKVKHYAFRSIPLSLSTAPRRNSNITHSHPTCSKVIITCDDDTSRIEPLLNVVVYATNCNHLDKTSYHRQHTE